MADVPRITNAPVPLTQDIGGRQRRYLISMTVRTVCLVLAVVVPGWPRWVFVAGAIVLPYVAVLIANAGRETARDAVEDPGDGAGLRDGADPEVLGTLNRPAIPGPNGPNGIDGTDAQDGPAPGGASREVPHWTP